MTLRTSKDHRLLMTRTANVYRHQALRALRAGAPALDYGLGDLRRIARVAIEQQPCLYCGETLTAATVSFDHLTPTSRGGSFDHSNLAVCCRRCNETKGSLDCYEFRSLLKLLRPWDDDSRRDVLRRLRAGGRVVRGG